MKNQAIGINRRDMINGFPESLFFKTVPLEEFTADTLQTIIRDSLALTIGFSFLNKGRASPSGMPVVLNSLEVTPAGGAKNHAGKSVVLDFLP